MSRLLSFMLLIAACSASVAFAHPTHTQVTEVEWNPTTRRFEVAMKLDAVALEDSVSVWRGQRYRLESSESIDDVLNRWLPKRFRILTDQTTEGQVRWVGHELELHAVWLYFEYSPKFPAAVAASSEPRDIRVENRCVMDVRPDAVHFVQLREGQRMKSGHCTRRQPVTAFSKDRSGAGFALQPPSVRWTSSAR